MSKRASKKKSRSLERLVAKREMYDLVLIVCEGEQTEPNYLQGLIRHQNLSSVNIQVEFDNPAPISVVEYAEKLYQEKLNDNTGEIYDSVYCVFDRDEHESFDRAINKAKNLNFVTICSYPCFEYWYLCHFIQSRVPINRKGANSPAWVCEKLLNDEWQKQLGAKYQKNDTQIYQKLLPLQQQAIKNAKFALKDAKQTDELNPSTQVHELVEYLFNIKPNH